MLWHKLKVISKRFQPMEGGGAPFIITKNHVYSQHTLKNIPTYKFSQNEKQYTYNVIDKNISDNILTL